MGRSNRYRAALEANPREPSAFAALRAVYIERGEVALAMELIGREIEFTDTPQAKARLCSEIAKLARDKLRDASRAEVAAKEALKHDAQQSRRATDFGRHGLRSDRMVEALTISRTWSRAWSRFPRIVATRTLRRHIEALARSGAADRALTSCDKLLEQAPEDQDALQVAARIFFEHGDAQRAQHLYSQLLERFGDKLAANEKAISVYRHGEAARRAGDMATAARSLTDAAELDATAAEPLAALAKMHESKSEWEDVIRVKNRRLDVATGEERVDLLVDIGEICATKIQDQTRAAKSLSDGTGGTSRMTASYSRA